MTIEDRLSILCSWCKSWIDKTHENDDVEEVVVSHGICTGCSDKFKDEFLDEEAQR